MIYCVFHGPLHPRKVLYFLHVRKFWPKKAFQTRDQLGYLRNLHTHKWHNPKHYFTELNSNTSRKLGERGVRIGLLNHWETDEIIDQDPICGTNRKDTNEGGFFYTEHFVQIQAPVFGLRLERYDLNAAKRRLEMSTRKFDSMTPDGLTFRGMPLKSRFWANFLRWMFP